MDRDTRKITNITETMVVDSNTGEVTNEVTTRTYKVPSEPHFVKLYLRDIIYLHDMPTALHGILHELLQIMDYDNLITVNSARKRLIATKLDIALSTISNGITSLVKANILIRRDVGMYVANPYLFGKGNWNDIYKIRLSVDYSIEGKSFQTEIKRNEQVQDNS
jgi:hypothetical protein